MGEFLAAMSAEIRNLEARNKALEEEIAQTRKAYESVFKDRLFWKRRCAQLKEDCDRWKRTCIDTQKDCDRWARLFKKAKRGEETDVSCSDSITARIQGRLA